MTGKQKAVPEHRLGWQDDQMANVTSCGGELIDGGFLVVPYEMRRCPVCNHCVTLVWDVYAKTVPESELIMGCPDD
jgi:hypothetical protein